MATVEEMNKLMRYRFQESVAGLQTKADTGILGHNQNVWGVDSKYAQHATIIKAELLEAESSFPVDVMVGFGYVDTRNFIPWLSSRVSSHTGENSCAFTLTPKQKISESVVLYEKKANQTQDKWQTKFANYNSGNLSVQGVYPYTDLPDEKGVMRKSINVEKHHPVIVEMLEDKNARRLLRAQMATEKSPTVCLHKEVFDKYLDVVVKKCENAPTVDLTKFAVIVKPYNSGDLESYGVELCQSGESGKQAYYDLVNVKGRVSFSIRYTYRCMQEEAPTVETKMKTLSVEDEYDSDYSDSD